MRPCEGRRAAVSSSPSMRHSNEFPTPEPLGGPGEQMSPGDIDLKQPGDLIVALSGLRTRNEVRQPL